MLLRLMMHDLRLLGHAFRGVRPPKVSPPESFAAIFAPKRLIIRVSVRMLLQIAIIRKQFAANVAGELFRVRRVRDLNVITQRRLALVTLSAMLARVLNVRMGPPHVRVQVDHGLGADVADDLGPFLGVHPLEMAAVVGQDAANGTRFLVHLLVVLVVDLEVGEGLFALDALHLDVVDAVRLELVSGHDDGRSGGGEVAHVALVMVQFSASGQGHVVVEVFLEVIGRVHLLLAFGALEGVVRVVNQAMGHELVVLHAVGVVLHRQLAERNDASPAVGVSGIQVRIMAQFAAIHRHAFWALKTTG